MINPMRQLDDGSWIGPGSAYRNRLEQEQRRRQAELEEMRARGLSTYEPMLAAEDPFRLSPMLGGETLTAYLSIKER